VAVVEAMVVAVAAAMAVGSVAAVVVAARVPRSAAGAEVADASAAP
jgi:hypothetical protein